MGVRELIMSNQLLILIQDSLFSQLSLLKKTTN